MRHVLSAVLAALASGCQTNMNAGPPTIDAAFPEPPAITTTAPPKQALELHLAAFDADQQAALRAVADAVTATEFCRLLEPNWSAMSQRFSETGIDGNAVATTAALDGESAAAAEPMRNQRTGAICDEAIAKYGPSGSEAPDFLKPATAQTSGPQDVPGPLS